MTIGRVESSVIDVAIGVLKLELIKIENEMSSLPLYAFRRRRELKEKQGIIFERFLHHRAALTHEVSIGENEDILAFTDHLLPEAETGEARGFARSQEWYLRRITRIGRA